MKQFRVIRDIKGLETSAKVGDILTIGEWESEQVLMKDGKAVCYNDDLDCWECCIDMDLVRNGKIIKQRIAELERKYSIIKKLYDKRIFQITDNMSDDSCFIFESCDDWFGYELSKQDCLELSSYFKELAEALDN